MAAPLVYPSIKVGDTFGLLQYKILLDGVALVIDPLTTVKFRMVDRNTPANVIVNDADGVLVDGPDGIAGSSGIVGYARKTNDVATAVQAVCQFTLTFPTGEIHVSPDINLDIVDDLP